MMSSREDEKDIVPISGRINANQFTPTLDYMLDEIGDDLYTKIGKPLRVYKFRQVSGYTIFTKNGEIPKYQNINQEEQFANFKTGKEPITLVWEGSSNLKNSIEEPNVNRYTFKVGSYETTYPIGEYTNELQTTEQEIFGANFVVDLKNTSLKVESDTWIPTNEDMINYFYIVVDSRYPSYQILQLKEYSTFYNEGTKGFYKSILEFENINLKYASTGRQILDFVQFGSIGFGYAFPKEVELENGEIEVQLDEIKLTSQGVNSIQLDTNSTSALQTIVVYGSPLNEFDNIYNQPQRLFLLDSLLPEESNLFYNDQQMNYYFVEGAKPKYKTYVESYTQNPNNPLLNLGSYNVGSEKKVLGGLFVNSAKVKATNTISSETGKYINSVDDNNSWIKLEGKYNIQEYINGMKDLTTTTILKTTDFLNFNSYINFYTDKFTYEIEEIIKFKLTDVFGILGSLINIIMGGIDVGWTKNKTLKLSQPMNFLIATSTYDMSTAIFPSTGEQPIPLELFSDNKEQALFPMDNKQLCSYHFSLTDYIKDSSQVIPNAPIGKGGEGIWNTKYIGQQLDENFQNLFPDGSIFKFNPSTTTAIPNPFDANTKYIIDTLETKMVYSGDMRITAYTKDYDLFTNEIYNRSVYSSISSTVSKIANKFRYTSTFIKFNYWEEFNTIGSVPNTWPQLLPNPTPTPISDIIWLEEIKAGSPLFGLQTIPGGTNIFPFTTLPKKPRGRRRIYLFQNIDSKEPFGPYLTFLGKETSPLVSTTRILPEITYEEDRALYETLIAGNVVESPERNNVSSNFFINLSKYDDETLAKFDRIA
ncbi:MAG: hypothetical protein ACRCRQ_01365, partial [Metamycoplasmataceae bacterium]